MAQSTISASPPPPATAVPALLSEQTMSSLFANIGHVYQHHFRVIFHCSALPMFPLLLLMEVVKVTAPKWVMLVVLPYSLVSFVVGGVMTVVLSDICLGNRPTVRRSYARILGENRWWHLISTGLVFSLGVSLGMLLLILPGLWLWVRGFFTFVIAALEGRRNRDAIKRSMALTKGQVWRVVGLTLPFYLILMVPIWGLGIVASGLPAMTGFVVSLLVNFVLLMVFTPAFALALVLLYYDQRVRRESYDAQALSEDLMR